MTTNVRLYPVYAALTNSLFWGPVFFLLMLQKVGLEQTLQLEAIYYIFSLVFEVPSGYFSDRIGRRKTLLISCYCFVFGYFLFSFSDLFWQFAVAQILLAAGFSFNSGTDHSLLYESLIALDKEHTFAEIEAQATKNSLYAKSLASFSGGVVGLVSLNLPYVLSGIAALISLFTVFKMSEPKVQAVLEGTLLKQLSSCMAYLKQPALLWMFLFFVFFTVLVHIPYEFFQPYTNLLDLSVLKDKNLTPFVVGTTQGIGNFIGAYVAANSNILLTRYGFAKIFCSSLLLESLLIGLMAFVLHPIIILCLFLRNIPFALIRAPLNSAINPKINSGHRATYFSLQKMTGNCCFAIFLYFISNMASSNIEPNWAELQPLLFGSLILAIVGTNLFIFTSKSLKGL